MREIETSLSEDNFSNGDKIGGLFRIGYLYTNIKVYEIASEFLKALKKALDIQFPYNPDFKYIFVLFIQKIQ